MKRVAERVCVCAVALLTIAARSNVRSGLILESKGVVSELAVGARAKQYPDLVLSAAKGTGQSRDGLYTVHLNKAGEIDSVTTRDAGVFTERLIRPQYSSLRDVLKAYGQSTAVRSDGTRMLVDYPGITFEFKPDTSTQRKDFFGTRVEAITVRKPPAVSEVKQVK
jgi:hypothetical protein